MFIINFNIIFIIIQRVEYVALAAESKAVNLGQVHFSILYNCFDW